MKWYLAKVVYRIICGNGAHTPQFDEQLRLIAANNAEEAFTKASALGRKEQEVFYNQKQQLVRWEFVNISELYTLDALIDGAELYSRITEEDDAHAYTRNVHRKAASLQQKEWPQLLNLI